MGILSDVPLQLDLSIYPGGSFVTLWNGNTSDPLSISLTKSYNDELSGTTNDIEHVTDTLDSNEYFIQRGRELGLDTYNKKMVIGAQFMSSQNIVAYYNIYPFHAAPVSLHYAMNAILKHFTSEDHSVTIINHPLPSEIPVTQEETLTGATMGFTVAFCVFFGLSFLTSTFVYFLIRERQVGSKQLQQLSGVGPFIFVAANFIWDLVNYMVPALLLLAMIEAFQIPAFTQDGRLGIVFIILVEYGFAVIPFMYAVQHIFASPATGVVTVIIVNILSGRQ